MKRLIASGFLLLYFLGTGAQVSELELTEFKEFSGYEEYIMDAEFSPFGQYFALTVGNNRIEVYNKDWERIWEHQGNPRSVGGKLVFSPDEQFLFFSKYRTNNDVAVLDLDKLEVVQVLTGHSDHIQALALSKDGHYLATACQDRLVRVWEWDGAQFVFLQEIDDHQKPVRDVVFSNDARYLLSVGDSRSVIIKELKGGEYKDFQVMVPGRTYIDEIVYHPLRDEFVVSADEKLRIARLQKGAFAFTDSIESREAGYRGYFMSFSPMGEYLCKGYISEIHFWKYDGKDYPLEKSVYRHTAVVFDVTFSQDGQYVVSSSKDHSSVIWKAEGLTPTPSSLIVQYLGKPLNTVQKNILDPKGQQKLLKSIDASLTAPRDEFETTEDYEKRKERLSAETLKQLQILTEDALDIGFSARTGMISAGIDEPLQYDADQEVYAIRAMMTPARVKIPLNEAREFRDNYRKYNIVAKRKISDDGVSYEYKGFTLVSPDGKLKYEVEFTENPLRAEKEKAPSGLLTKGSGGDSEVIEFRGDPGAAAGEGRTIALLFATNLYDGGFNQLVNPIKDAQTLAAELSEHYGARTEVVKNANLQECIGKIREYAAREYQPNDRLLIFFAGHGMFDDIFKEGYVILRDSKVFDETKTTYLSHSNLRTMVNNIPCEHIMLIMDVCFGGTFDPLIASTNRGSNIYDEITKTEFIARKMKFKTRLYLTSGGKEYVPDGRPGMHSPFTRKILEALRGYGGKDGILTVNEIITAVEKVEPQPRFGEFGDNEPGSDFILIAK